MGVARSGAAIQPASSGRACDAHRSPSRRALSPFSAAGRCSSIAPSQAECSAGSSRPIACSSSGVISSADSRSWSMAGPLTQAGSTRSIIASNGSNGSARRNATGRSAKVSHGPCAARSASTRPPCASGGAALSSSPVSGWANPTVSSPHTRSGRIVATQGSLSRCSARRGSRNATAGNAGGRYSSTGASGSASCDSRPPPSTQASTVACVVATVYSPGMTSTAAAAAGACAVAACAAAPVAGAARASTPAGAAPGPRGAAASAMPDPSTIMTRSPPPRPTGSASPRQFQVNPSAPAHVRRPRPRARRRHPPPSPPAPRP